MHCILSEKPITEFFEAEDKYKYIDSLKYFSIKARINKQNLFQEMYSWVMFYAGFHKSPLYVALATDNYWFEKTKGDKISNTVKITCWVDMPSTYPYKNSEKYLPLIPAKKRIWNDEDYFLKACELINENNFQVNPYVEVKLDGKGITPTTPIVKRKGKRLCDNFVGLFEYQGDIFFKSEYGSNYTDENGNTMIQHDCYCVKSGEYFWGGVDTVKKRENLIVYPITYRKAKTLIEKDKEYN